MYLLHALTVFVAVFMLVNTGHDIGPEHQEVHKSDSELLKSIVDDFYAWRLENWPEYGTKFNNNENNKEIDVYTEDAFAYQVGNATEFLSRITVINTDNLSQQEKFSKIILEDNLRIFINGYEFRIHGMYNSMARGEAPFSQYMHMLRFMPKKTRDHFDDILDRFRAIPKQLTDRANLMRIAIEKGITLHLFDVESSVNSMEDEMRSHVNSSSFFKVFRDQELPDSITDKKELQAECRHVIENVARPALQNFTNFIRTEYWPNLRAEIGVGSLPQGQEFYQQCLYWHLGPDATAEKVHNMGLKEVKRIRETIQQYLDENGFNGSMKDYTDFLREQPEQYYNTSEAVLDAYREIIASVHDKLSAVLLKVPAVPITVISSASTGNRYSAPARPGDPGIFSASSIDPSNVPKYGMVALALHEAEPGHHTQEVYEKGDELPSFRTNIEFLRYNAVPFNWPFQTAYSEGWALYAEFLGEAMGAYKNDSTTLIGRYFSEILRAARLVVDTGMHSKGWTFEQAQAYFSNNTALSATSINSELKRYISFPGQACAYKYGELKIRELRERAEKHFGDEFDQKVFHDKVLSFGNAPLSLLEEQIDTWLEESSPTQPGTACCHTSPTLTLIAFLIFLKFQ